MATPRADAYAAATGGVIYGGNSAPKWYDSVPTRQWTALAGTNFRSNVTALMPYTGFPGADPIGALVDAYGDPCPDESNNVVFFHGGGHTNGMNNAVVQLDLRTLQYQLTIRPCDPSKWPPVFAATSTDRAGTLQYPSGATPGYYSSTLTDPRDTPYNQLADSPVVTHQYGAFACRAGRITYFYNQYREAETGLGTWPHIADIDLGAQLYAINPNYQRGVLGQGTMAVYDSVTDRYYVTLVPGDSGYNWRGGFIAYNPVTRQLQGSYIVGTPTRSGMNFFLAGRKVYGLMHDESQPNKAWRVNLDTKAVEYLVFVGDTMAYSPNANLETLPANYHSGRNSIVRWGGQFDLNALYEVNLSAAPVGGDGSVGNPYQLTQTRIPIAGASPPAPLLNYHRLYFNATTGCLMFLPKADSTWYAVKL